MPKRHVHILINVSSMVQRLQQDSWQFEVFVKKTLRAKFSWTSTCPYKEKTDCRKDLYFATNLHGMSDLVIQLTRVVVGVSSTAC